MEIHSTTKLTFSGYLLALEGGGTRSQAALMDAAGRLLQISDASEVNTNFVSFEQAQQAVLSAVRGVLQSAGVGGEAVGLVASALVGAHFGPETLGALLPEAVFRHYSERDVIFARAGIYHPHGIAVVAATGATAFGVRLDDGREVLMGGWGALLGDEGSAYALGLLGLRIAARAYEGRQPASTRLMEAVCQHFGLHEANFRQELIALAYQKPLSRAEIAGLAAGVTRLAGEGDRAAAHLTAKVAGDLAALGLHACRRLFEEYETFDLVIGGGLANAGYVILAPLQQGLAQEFPHASFMIGKEQPAAALGRLALHNLLDENPNP